MTHLWRLLLIGLFLGGAATVYAGGAIQTNINGLPLHWDVSSGLTYNPDSGGLKSDGAYPPAASQQLLRECFDTWETISGNLLNILPGTVLPGGDVNASNYENFLNAGTEACYDDPSAGTPCFTPIIFDEDGEIIDDLFGTCAKFSILGFAGFDDIDDGSGDPALLIVKRGQALFSGACLPPVAVKTGCGTCKRPLSDQEIRTIITHEVGHMMGMDHSQVNPDVYEQCSVSGGCPVSVADGLPTMFPILVEGAQMQDLMVDDEAYFLRLYGDPNAHASCSVSGTIFASDGATEVRGVEVVARNSDPALNIVDAISFISGAEAPRINDFSHGQGNCESDCGDYKITGLSNGQTYQLCVQKIKSQFTGGSSIEPVDPPFQGFTDDCPAGVTVTCSCPGGVCQDFTGMNITTDTDPNAIAQPEDPPQIVPQDTETGGGCSLARPRAGIWKKVMAGLIIVK